MKRFIFIVLKALGGLWVIIGLALLSLILIKGFVNSTVDWTVNIIIAFTLTPGLWLFIFSHKKLKVIEKHIEESGKIIKQGYKYIIYNVFGGIFAVLSFLNLIIEVLERYNLRAPERPINWGFVICSLVNISMCVCLLVLSNKKLIELKKDSHTLGQEDTKGSDWKAMLLSATIFIFWICYIMFYHQTN